jgi:hypothetical protein
VHDLIFGWHEFCFKFSCLSILNLVGQPLRINQEAKQEYQNAKPILTKGGNK